MMCQGYCRLMLMYVAAVTPNNMELDIKLKPHISVKRKFLKMKYIFIKRNTVEWLPSV